MSNNSVPQNKRILKALQLLGAGNIRPTIEWYRFTVASQADENKYTVDLRTSQPYCRQSDGGTQCPDLKYNSPPQGKCKHILAVQMRSEKRHEITEFLSRRDDITLTAIAGRADQEVTHWERNLCFTHTEKLSKATAQALAHAARELLDEQQRTDAAQAEQRRATEFQVRFWWPDWHPEDLLDPINSFAAEEPRQIDIHDASGWRACTERAAGIRAYIADNNLIVGKPTTSGAARRGEESQFIIPVYREKEKI